MKNKFYWLCEKLFTRVNLMLVMVLPFLWSFAYFIMPAVFAGQYVLAGFLVLMVTLFIRAVYSITPENLQ